MTAKFSVRGLERIVSSGGSKLVLGPILSVSAIVLNLIMTIWGVNLDAVRYEHRSTALSWVYA